MEPNSLWQAGVGPDDAEQELGTGVIPESNADDKQGGSAEQAIQAVAI